MQDKVWICECGKTLYWTDIQGVNELQEYDFIKKICRIGW